MNAFYQSVTAWLIKRGVDAVTVTKLSVEERSMGYCETCYSEYLVVVIRYINSEGRVCEHEGYTSPTDLIEELSSL